MMNSGALAIKCRFGREVERGTCKLVGRRGFRAEWEFVPIPTDGQDSSITEVRADLKKIEGQTLFGAGWQLGSRGGTGWSRMGTAAAWK